MRTNWKLFWPMALIISCGVFYQVGLKEVSHAVHPLLVLCLTYLSAALTVLVLCIGQMGYRAGNALLRVSLPALGISAAIVGIELGNIYMYRAGWTVNSAFIVANGLIVIALLVLGAAAYGEKISLRKILGILLIMAGVGLIIGWPGK